MYVLCFDWSEFLGQNGVHVNNKRIHFRCSELQLIVAMETRHNCRHFRMLTCRNETVRGRRHHPCSENN